MGRARSVSLGRAGKRRKERWAAWAGREGRRERWPSEREIDLIIFLEILFACFKFK